MLKMFAAVGMVAVMGLGLTGCGEGYTGGGVVVSKDIDKTSSTSKKSSSRNAYNITLDVPESDMDMQLRVSKSEYDRIKLGQTVKFEKGSIK
jgi:hypothetical protein